MRRLSPFLQPIAEERIEFVDGVDLFGRLLGGVKNTPELEEIVGEQHVAGPRVAIAGLADAPDVDHHLHIRKFKAAADIIGLAASLVLVWYGTVMTAQSARLGSLTIKNLVFPEWWLLAPLPICFALLTLEFVFRFRRLMGAPRTRRHEATSVG